MRELRNDVLAARAAQVAAALALDEEAPVRARDVRSLRAAALGFVATAIALAAWRPALEWLAVRWSDPHGYYGHGPLVPLIAGALAWRERKRLVLASDGLVAGSIILAVAVLLQVAAAALRVHFVSGAALLLAIVAACLLLGGVAFARALAFPLGFLALALPLPMDWIARASLELKLLAAGAATRSLELAGIGAVREGSAIHLAQGDVMVEDACSGLRSLLALISMGVLVAGLDRGVALRRRAIVVLLALPIAIAANAARVAFLCVAVQGWGPLVLETWVHEGSGFFVYGLSLGLLLAARRVLLSGSGVTAGPGRPGRGSSVAIAGDGRSATRTAALALALVPCVAATLLLDRKPSVTAPPIATALPAAIGSWTATELPIEDYVRKILDTNDLISRRYSKEGREPVFLYVAASRGDRKVAHPPEVCAPGNGYLVLDHEEVPLARGVRAVRFVLARGKDRRLIVYFYAAGSWLGPSYVGSQLRAALERFRSPDVPSALVRLCVPLRGGEPFEETWESVRDFADGLVPALEERLAEGTK